MRDQLWWSLATHPSTTTTHLVTSKSSLEVHLENPAVARVHWECCELSRGHKSTPLGTGMQLKYAKQHGCVWGSERMAVWC